MQFLQRDIVLHDLEELLNNTTNNKVRIKPKFEKYFSNYTFTTENLDSYLSTLDIRNKKVLTVASSGDQIINLALLGASHIDCFDISRLSYYFVKLKIAALINLNYNEFLDYFTSSETSCRIGDFVYPINPNEKCFDFDLYLKIRVILDDDVKLFFDKIYEYYDYDGEKVKLSGLFNNISRDIAIFNNTYLINGLNYLMAKYAFMNFVNNNLDFYDLDVYNLINLSKTYDIILLSNIYDYIGVDKSDFISYIQKDLARLLNPNGKIEINYQYRFRQRKSKICDNMPILVNKYDNDYFNLDLLNDLTNISYSIIGVPNILHFDRDVGIEDCVYVYKR